MNQSLRSLVADANQIRTLRQSLGWTQDHAAAKSGYSSRLIRKLESGGGVRPETLNDVLQCYHEASGIEQWLVSDFLLADEASEKFRADELTDEQSRQIARIREYYITMFNRREFHRLSEFVVEDILFRHGNGEQAQGIEIIQQLIETMLSAFNPIEFSFDRSFIHEQDVFTYWRVRQKHVGTFSDVPATNQWYDVCGNSRCKLIGDKVFDVEDNWDVYDLLRQLKGEPYTWL